MRVLTKVFTSYSLKYLRVLTKVFTSYLLKYLHVLTKVFTSYSLKYLRVLTKVFTSYLLKYLRVLIETSTSYSFYCCCYRRAPTGRYSCTAQGASPGLGIDTHFLSPVGAAQAQCKCPTILALLVPLLKELILLLSVDTQGFISGFALIPPWALKKYRV